MNFKTLWAHLYSGKLQSISGLLMASSHFFLISASLGRRKTDSPWPRHPGNRQYLFFTLGAIWKSLPQIHIKGPTDATGQKEFLKIVAFFDRTVRIYVVWRHQPWKWRHSKRSRSSLSRPAFDSTNHRRQEIFSHQSQKSFDAFW